MMEMRLTAKAPKKHRLEDAGMPQGHLEMLAGEDPLGAGHGGPRMGLGDAEDGS